MHGMDNGRRGRRRMLTSDAGQRGDDCSGAPVNEGAGNRAQTSPVTLELHAHSKTTGAGALAVPSPREDTEGRANPDLLPMTRFNVRCAFACRRARPVARARLVPQCCAMRASCAPGCSGEVPRDR